MINYQLIPEDEIDEVLETLLKLAKKTSQTIFCHFNGFNLFVTPNTDIDRLSEKYRNFMGEKKMNDQPTFGDHAISKYKDGDLTRLEAMSIAQDFPATNPVVIEENGERKVRTTTNFNTLEIEWEYEANS